MNMRCNATKGYRFSIGKHSSGQVPCARLGRLESRDSSNPDDGVVGGRKKRCSSKR